MVQLGICAFRQGVTKDEHNALLDIQSSSRAKELLGQGLLLRSLQECNQEQEKVERRQQVPFHLHINLDCQKVFTWCRPCSWRSPTWPPMRVTPLDA